MTDLSTLIQSVQSKFDNYKDQLEILRKETKMDIQSVEEKHTEFSDWLESKKDEVDKIISDGKLRGTSLALIGDQANGIMDDIESTMQDWTFEYQDELENH